jgi:hypothetical protein
MKEPTDVQHISKGLTCPKCSKTDIHRPFGGWRWFLASIVLLCLSNKLLELQLIKVTESFFSPYDLIPSPFSQKKEIPIEVINKAQTAAAAPFYVVNVCLILFAVWMLYIALFGKNKCAACGHRWSPFVRILKRVIAENV